MFSGASAVKTGVHIDYLERTPGCGCIGHPAFPAPSVHRKGENFQEASGETRRENANACDVIARSASPEIEPSMAASAPMLRMAESICRNLVLPDRIELSTSPLPRK